MTSGPRQCEECGDQSPKKNQPPEQQAEIVARSRQHGVDRVARGPDR